MSLHLSLPRGLRGLEDKAEGGLRHAAQSASHVAQSAGSAASGAGHSLADIAVHAGQEAVQHPLQAGYNITNNPLTGFGQHLWDAAGKTLQTVDNDVKTPHEAGHGLVSDGFALAGDALGLATNLNDPGKEAALALKTGGDLIHTDRDGRERAKILREEAEGGLGVAAKSVHKGASLSEKEAEKAAKFARKAKYLKAGKALPGLGLLAAATDITQAVEDGRDGKKADMGFDIAQAVGDGLDGVGLEEVGLAVNAAAFGGQEYYDTEVEKKPLFN